MARPFKNPASTPTMTSHLNDSAALNCHSRHNAKQAINTPLPATPRTRSDCQYCNASTPKGVPNKIPKHSTMTHRHGILCHTLGSKCKLAITSITNIRGTMVRALRIGAKAKKHRAEKPKPAKPLITPAKRTIPRA